MNFIHYFSFIAGRKKAEQATFPSSITLKVACFTLVLSIFSALQVQARELTKDLPSPDSLTMLRQVIETKDSRTLYLAYRALPQMKRTEATDLTLNLFQNISSTELKRALVEGMGKSGNPFYTETLLKNFAEAKTEVRQSNAESLGLLHEKQAFPLFAGYLRDRRNWMTTPLTTEAVILAIAKIGSPEECDPLFQPLVREMPDSKLMALDFSRDPVKDRLAGALAWAYGDLLGKTWGKSTDLNNFIEGLFVAHSPRSSIMAAKTLLQAKDPRAEAYLTGLLNNPNVLISLRILSGKALASTLGKNAFSLFKAAGPESPQILLNMVQELKPGELSTDKAIELIAKNDDALIIEGALALARSGKKEHLEPVKTRSQEKTLHLVTRAILYYAWEEIASL